MDVTSVDELKEMFEMKIHGLTKCMDLSSAVLTPDGLDESFKKQLGSIHRELCMVESLVTQLKDIVHSEGQQLQRAKDLKEEMEQQVKHIKYIESNIPNRLPGIPSKQSKAETNTKTSKGRTPLGAVQDNQSNDKAHPKTAGKDRPKSKKVLVPKMEFVTVDEFDCIPKYMKGRLDYDTINAAVEIINSALTARYTLLHKPRSALGEKAMKRVRMLKEQENKDTKGVFFFTDEDFKASSNGRCSTNSRSIFTILRHCRRLREIRTGSLTRYALVP